MNTTVVCAGLIIAASGSVLADDGAKTYQLVCSSCHDSAAAGAPKLDDKANWEPRIAQGKDALYASMINGKCAMQAKAGRIDLSDEVVKAAVDHMVAQAR